MKMIILKQYKGRHALYKDIHLCLFLTHTLFSLFPFIDLSPLFFISSQESSSPSPPFVIINFPLLPNHINIKKQKLKSLILFVPDNLSVFRQRRQRFFTLPEKKTLSLCSVLLDFFTPKETF